MSNDTNMNNNYYLTYSLIMKDVKELYYIKITENTSTIKGKNAIAKTVYPRQLELMGINDTDLIKIMKQGNK